MRASPEAEEQGTGLLAHLVVWDDVSKCKSDVPDVLQDRIALLPLAHQDGIGVHLHSHESSMSIACNLGIDWPGPGNLLESDVRVFGTHVHS